MLNSLDFVVHAAAVGNPLDDSTFMDAFFSFVSAVVAALLPFLVLAFIFAGLYFILARGNSSALGDARSFFFKLLIATVLILGAGIFISLFINLIKSLYSAL